MRRAGRKERRGTRRGLRRRQAGPILVVLAVAASILLWRSGGLHNSHSPRGDPRAIPSEGHVSFVTDGDTIRLSRGEKVRYLGIDSPEYGEAYYEQARSRNRRLVEGRRVELRRGGPEERDRYGRTLALVYVKGTTPSGSLCVNLALVREGLASVYIAHENAVLKEALKDLITAQRTAISQRRGIWSTRLSRPPGDPPLISTRFRIHRAGCNRRGSRLPDRVQDLEEEFRSGKSLCRSCKPLE